MIKINNLNKYYNKKSSNSLHVINDITLTLSDTGLVTFLGKSGCGKTTLLNVISGNDSSDSGTIIYDQKEFRKYNAKEIDAYRQKNIGYIFQNYLLIENLSVYDNLKEALEIIGIYDKEEQKRRIEYALNVVGLYKYRKKLANRLSGGEQQRVSIARSLVKNSKVIIADEPTGNLDSENSIVIMNILKQISQTTLVLLVTHNEELANAYSDRIIKLSDGKIIDDSDDTGGVVNTTITSKSEKAIHLLDYEKTHLSNSDSNVLIYKDDSDVTINVRIILKNNTLYIDSPNKVVLAKDTNIEIINDHYKEVKKVEIDKSTFDISFYNDDNKGHHNFFKDFIFSVKKFFVSSKRQRTFRSIFFIVGIIIAVCAINFANALTIDTSKNNNEDVYVIDNGDHFYHYGYNSIDIIKEGIENGAIEEAFRLETTYYGNTYSIKYKLNSVRSMTYYLDVYNYPYSLTEGYDLLCGSSPKQNHDIVIGKRLADDILKTFELKNYSNLLGLTLDSKGVTPFVICGVSSKETNSVYFMDIVSKNFDYTFVSNNIYNIYDYNTFKDSTKLKLISSNGDINQIGGIYVSTKAIDKGLKLNEQTNFGIIQGIFEPINPNFDIEIIASFAYDCGVQIDEYNNLFEKYPYDYRYGTSTVSVYEDVKDYIELFDGRLPSGKNEIIVPVGISHYTLLEKSRECKIVGTYIQKNLDFTFGIICDQSSYFEIVEMTNGFTNYTYKVSDSNYVFSNGAKFEKLTNYQYIYQLENNQEKLIVLIPVSLFFVVIMVYVYFTTRSRMLVNIRNIGIKRSIGAKKTQILREYFVDAFVETIFTSLLGYLIVTIGYFAVMVKFSVLTNTVINGVTILVLIVFSILLFLVNIIFGLLPVWSLLRKTPSEIISKYDI